jgi:hypothetical protein
MFRPSTKQIVPLLVLLLALAVLPSGTSGQSSPARARPRPANVVAGTLSSMDAEAATVGIKGKSGAETLYRVTDKTQLWLGRKLAELSAFQVGEGVVVRFRKSSVGPATLYDLADTASWAWVDRLRHDTTPVTVKEIDDESLLAEESGGTFSYRVTEKSQWSKAGKPVPASDYKAGDKVYVVPRLLPGGGTMAIAISDGGSDAAKLKERSRFTVSGTIRTWNAEKRTISLATAAGDDRSLTLLPDCAIRNSGKDVPISYVRQGQAVTLHLTRDETGGQVVKQVTIKKAAAKKLPARPGAKAATRKP